MMATPAAPEGRLQLVHDSLTPHRPSLMYDSRSWPWRRKKRDGIPVDPLSVSHLSRLGFTKETARNALLYARNDVALAIELAIHDSHEGGYNHKCPVCQGRSENVEMRQWFKDQDLRPIKKFESGMALGDPIRPPPEAPGSGAGWIAAGAPAAAAAAGSGYSTPIARHPSSLQIPSRAASSLSGYATAGTATPSQYHDCEDDSHSDGNLDSDADLFYQSPGAEPDRGDEDGDTSWMNPMPTTPHGPDRLTPPQRVFEPLALGDASPTFVPLNDSYGSRTRVSSNYSSRERDRERERDLSSSRTSHHHRSMDGSHHKRSMESMSNRTHSRVQSTSSFYEWYQSSTVTGSDIQASPTSVSCTRVRSSSIGRAL